MFGFFKRKRHASFSPEVQVLWSEVEKFRVRYRGSGRSNERAFDDAAEEIFATLIAQGSFAADLIIKRGWSIADATHMMIAEHVSAEILSGKLHSYRGILNDKGNAYLKLFKVCTEKMISSGRIPAQEGDAGMRDFEQEIAAIG